MINEGADRKQSTNTYRIASLAFLILAFPFLLVCAILGEFNGYIGARFVLIIIGACLLTAGTIFLFLTEFEKGKKKGAK